ncbi:NADH:ubiquinone oxidoreductase 17.2kDa subunit isoform 1 [Tripterygium wilfordii]|uniref:NADH dehydrogenase [ubiquinone] 1 alpha subcomplex subunit 12 n=1 Tax=Tripterygium wilfordii TaxID=458696 RepID=A0A7J7C8R6_TRIWF|nr:NADH dehydrogenase [ubiquinone] 1 alpha subcomplex assembly factor 2-like [Tripterygium wilfordii]KAF5730544.1 NADH:ubiquinone oxidoreductase 17.2kDa subunit isoform 1 [Tripterygium wilfordii]
MSKLFSRIAGLFSSRTFTGIDKAGNRYFAKKEEIDGIVKEKRWVIFKGEEDPTTVPVEWICWLNGQRKRAPTPEEMMELEARRERVRLNVELLKKEEEEKRAKEGPARKVKAGGPDLKSFMQQIPSSEADEAEEASGTRHEARSKETEAGKAKEEPLPESSEPTGSGASFQPGTWRPPT